ncbi:MAG: aldo/keto reductase [Gemmatimonadales bacterium]|jgi:predicted aldo/keto reductase-like oxidoreductase
MTIEQQPQSRRAFLSNSVAGIASIGLAGATPQLAVAQPKQQASAQPIQRTLGRTGIELPVISIGAMNSDSPDLYHRAYDIGIRHFDTAEVYLRGRSEEVLGTFMKERGNRDEICLSTKIGSSTRRVERSRLRSGLERAFEGCLRRLQTDYVDILYYHGQSNAAGVNDEIAGEYFAELQQQGKIRWPGISTHSGQAEVLNEMAKGDFWSVALVGFNVTMAQNQELLAAMTNATSKGVGIVGMKALGGGRRGPASDPSTPDFNKTAMLKWILNHDEVTTIIPGVTTFDQLDLNWSVVSDLSYTAEERSFLGQRDLQGMLQFCQQCNECVPTCPKGVDVPTLMRTYMYAAQYSNFTHARMTLDEIPARQSLSACGSCAECTARCSNAISIAGRIGALKSMYLA